MKKYYLNRKATRPDEKLETEFGEINCFWGINLGRMESKFFDRF